MIGKMVRIAQMMFEGGFQSGKCLFIKTKYKLFTRWRGENFVKKDFKISVRNSVEAEGRLAHFPNTLAYGSSVLGAEMSVKAEGHLQFIKRLAGDAGGENLVQA